MKNSNKKVFNKMNNKDKNALYESIMKSVAKTVKNALNESMDASIDEKCSMVYNHSPYFLTDMAFRTALKTLEKKDPETWKWCIEREYEKCALCDWDPEAIWNSDYDV